MIGTTVITQRHCEGRDAAIDPIAVAAFIVDTHHCRRIVQAGEVRNEGDVEVVTDPFAVSYGALTPRAEECENLLVPVCLSATHIAYGSLRTEPVFIQLGEAAGLAASQAAKLRRPVQEVDLPRLRRELEQRNAVVSVEPKRKRGEAPWPHEGHRYESPD